MDSVCAADGSVNASCIPGFVVPREERCDSASQQGTGGDCQLTAVTPFVLHGSANQTWALTLGNYEEDYPVVHDPTSPNVLGPLNQTQLVATPEPGTLGVVGVAIAAVFGFTRRRRS